jgi:hypothetical protein
MLIFHLLRRIPARRAARSNLFLSDEDGDGGFGVTKSVARFRRRISQLVLPSAASAVLLAGVIALIRLPEYPSRW